MGRSRTRKAAGGHAPAAPARAPLVSLRAIEGVLFEPLTERGDEARRLFGYAGAWAPPASPGEAAWGARAADQKLIGALLLEKKGAAGMLYGPVVVLTPGATWDPIEIAARLLAALVTHATASGVETLFARPQGLDRVWVRFGFIPIPEADLPRVFKGRPGTGLFAWRGGTALWSARRRETEGEENVREAESSPRPPRGRGTG